MSTLLYEIANLSKPRAAAEAVKRAHEYLDHMRSRGKPVTSIAFKPTDYDQIFRSINAGRDAALPEVTGLRIGEVRVTRGGA